MINQEIIKKVEEIIQPIYLVGGSVRDEILGRDTNDYDFTTPLSPNQIEDKIRKAGKKPNLIGKRFGTIMMKIDGINIEITSFRMEFYSQNNRKPNVVLTNKLSVDLSRRDFTMNALAKKGNKYIDLFDGIRDINNKVIRAVGNPTNRFKEDPLRILRACRFAAQLGFIIEEKTLRSITKNAHRILEVSKERWTQELDRLLLGNNASLGLMYLWNTRLFSYLIPELQIQYQYNQNSRYHELLLHRHTMIVVENVQGLELRWAALLHDIAKPFTRLDKECMEGTVKEREIIRSIIKSNYPHHDLLGCDMAKRIGEHLRWSNERIKVVSELVLNHLNDDSPLRKADFIGKKLEVKK